MARLNGNINRHSNRFSFKRMIAAFFVVTLIVLAIIFFAFQKNKERAFASSRLVEHTYEVLSVAEKINTGINEMQSGARGYIISGEQSYLDAYYILSARIDSTVGQFNKLTKDNPSQQLRIDTLRTLINSYIVSRNQLVSVRQALGFEEAQKLFLHDSGRLIIDKMHATVASMTNEENRLLSERKGSSEESVKRSSRMTVLLFGIVVLLLLIAFYIIYKNNKARDSAEIALQKSRQFLKAIIDNTSSPITIRDTEGKYILINKPVTKLFGREEEDIIGKSSYEFLPKEKADEARQADEECIRTRSITHSEISVPFNNKTHYFSVNRFPLFDDNDNVSAIGTLSTDVSYIKKAEEEIRALNMGLEKRVEEKTKEVIEKERQYRFLIENMREGIQILGFDWRYIFVNKAVVHQSKYSKEELLDRTIIESYPGVESTELFRLLKLCMEERIPQVMESEFVFPDGTTEWFELSIQPVPEGVFILSMDITGRKHAEIVLKKFAGELKKSNTELERFAYIASHDLQEPLRMVSSFLNLLEDELGDKLNDTAKEYINFAVDGATRMKKLVNDLLHYSRVGTNKEEFIDVDINETTQYVLRVLDEEIKKLGAVVTVLPLPVIRANKTLMSQLFMNLIGNALKYHGESKPAIEVGYTDEKDGYVFYVKDNGIGIDSKFFEKIFIIFQRLHNKTEHSGTGIGLAICKKIVEAHNGKIWVESTEGKGSTFYFSIPKNSK